MNFLNTNAAHSGSLHTPRLLTVKEAMDALRVRRTTLYGLVNRGDLPQPIKIGARSFWLASDIEDFVRVRVAERTVLH